MVMTLSRNEANKLIDRGRVKETREKGEGEKDGRPSLTLEKYLSDDS